MTVEILDEKEIVKPIDKNKPNWWLSVMPYEEARPLEVFAEFMNLLDVHNTYTVDVVYFDFGQNWLWKTVVKEDPRGNKTWAISPVMQKLLLESKDKFEVFDLAKGHCWHHKINITF